MMRRITSILLAISFVIVSVSGLQMTFSHKEKAPQVQTMVISDASAVDKTKSFYPKEAHEWFGYLFIGAGLVHCGLNIKPMESYLGLRRKKSVRPQINQD